MKKSLCIALAVLALLALSACTPPAAQAPYRELEDNEGGEIVANDDFMLSITVEKSAYTADEQIVCQATLTYMGTDPLTLYHGDPLVVFYIEGGKFNGEWAQNNVLDRTTFDPGDEMTVAFSKSGGYSADDPDADFFEAYYKEPELVLSEGEYTLSTQMEYATDENDVGGTTQTLSASVDVTVTQ